MREIKNTNMVRKDKKDVEGQEAVERQSERQTEQETDRARDRQSERERRRESDTERQNRVRER